MAGNKTFYTSDFRYSGGMNYDDFVLAIQKGDVTNCLNVFTLQVGEGQDNQMTPANGNQFSFELPTISAQNKIYQFNITEPISWYGRNTYSVNFLNLNYSLIANVTITLTGVIATDATTFQNAISSALTGYTPIISHTISGSTATFTLELTGMMGFDWLMQDNPVLTITDSGNSWTGFSNGDTITDQTSNLLLGTILSVTTGTLILQNITGNNVGATDTLVNQSATTVTLTAGTGTFSDLTNPIVTQEAIDVGLTDFNNGVCLPIGGIDYLNDLFIFSTCQGNPPQSFNLLSVDNYMGGIVLQISGDQTALFSIGESIIVSGVEGAVPANGTWSVQGTSLTAGNTNILLYGTSFSGSYSGGGVVSIYNEGFLNISVHQKNLGTGVWTNYSLLSTKAINSRFYFPFRKEIVANKNGNILALYWVDGNDLDRLFEYTGAYITNGAIEYYNPLGLYTYDNIVFATRNLTNSPSSIVKVIAVSDTGGGILSGDWQLTVQPLDSTLTAGQISIPTNAVNIFNGSFGSPSQILGTPGVKSSMQITVQVSDIPENVYSFMNLIGIYHTGGTETAYLIKQVPIPTDATTLNITFTGLETLTAYTDGFLFSSLGYINSGTQTVCSNTLVKADLNAAPIADYSALSQLWTHVLNRNTTALQPTGDYYQNVGTLGEYQVPTATANYLSGMLNETYRIGLVYELLTGEFTPPYWCDDIRFDLNTPIGLGGQGNVANPFGDVGRRTGNNIPNYDLSESISTTAGADVNSYVFYATLSPPLGWQSYLIGGIPLNQVVKRVHVFRVDNNVAGTNEVLSSGLIVRHVEGEATGGGLTLAGFGGAGANNYLWENPFLITNLGSVGHIPIIANIYNTYNTLFGSEPNGYQYGAWDLYGGQITPTGSDLYWQYSCSFYSPDIIYGQTSINYEGGSDTIFDYGTPDWNTGTGTGSDMYCVSQDTVPPSTGTTVWGTEIQMSGSTHLTIDAFGSSTINLGLQQAINIGDFAGVTPSNLAGGINLCSASAGTVLFDTPSKIWLYTKSSIPIPSLSVQAPDIGLHYGQYYRNLGSITASVEAVNYPNNTKFGAITTGIYIPTGSYLDVTDTATSIDVYGWDAFNQKCFLKIRYPSDTTNATQGGGVTVMYIGQNRINFNMRNPGGLAYPQSPAINGWINLPNGNVSGGVTEVDNYDIGYTPVNPDVSLVAYNPALPYITSLPERIIYSLVQPQNSVSNNWKVFPPLNFYDLDSAQGIITNITTLEQELVSIQQKSTNRQFYNERGTINIDEPSGGTEATLGSGSPFSKPGEPIVSNRGNSNNHGLLKGVGANGETVLAWIDIISQEVIVVNREANIISQNKMRSFFKNNLSFVSADTPVQAPQNPYFTPLNGVWDDKRKQFVWTVYGETSAGEFVNSSMVSYSFGEIVTNGTIGQAALPQAFISLANGNIGNIPNSLTITDSGNAFSGFNTGDTITDLTNSQVLGIVKSISTITGSLVLINNIGNNISSPTDRLGNQLGETVNLVHATSTNSQPYWFPAPYSDATSTAGSSVLLTMVSGSVTFPVGATVTDSLGNTGTVLYANNNIVVSNNIKQVSGSGFTDTLTSGNQTTIVSTNKIIGEVYQYYTIVYSIIPMTNEKGERVTGGRFTTFLSPRPYFYVQWMNTYLTASPSIADNRLYEDDIGAILEWYFQGSFVANGSLTFPVNDFPDVSKRWVGVWSNSLNIPYYLAFDTQECASFLPNTDPDWNNINNDGYYNAIQNDTLTAPNGTPQEDTTFLYGSWMTTTITFLTNTNQSIFKIVTKFVPLSRLPNT
jgi:hypothetical protein